MMNLFNATEVALWNLDANWAFFVIGLKSATIIKKALVVLLMIIRTVVGEQLSTLNLNRPNMLRVAESYIINFNGIDRRL